MPISKIISVHWKNIRLGCFHIQLLFRNIRDRIYCMKTKASTSYSKLSPSKYDPPNCMQRFQRSFHFSMHVWWASLGMARNCRVVFSCISATSWNRFPFRVLFSLGKRKKLQGSKVGGEPQGCCAWPRIPRHSGPRSMAHCHGAASRYWKTICEVISDELHLEGIAERLCRQSGIGEETCDAPDLPRGLYVDHCRWMCSHFSIGEYHSNVLDWLSAVSPNACNILYVSVAVLPSFWQNVMQTCCSFITSISQCNGGTNTIAL
jgi:hypothetical protein